MIWLVESFYSFQGEGKFAGSPSIFIRFGGCNLNCSGFGVEVQSPLCGEILKGCDSIRAVQAEHFKNSWKVLHSTRELIDEVTIFLKDLSFKPDIVFTGGEPLLHYQNPILYETIQYFVKNGHRITIETNMTTLIDFDKYPMYKEIIFAMSVKLSNSGEAYTKRINFKAINAVIKNAKEAFFKFVLDRQMIETGEAAKEIGDIMQHVLSAPVYCMPLGETAAALEKNDKAVANFCIRNGYHYIDRMHIRLWDNEEGK